jgi:EthD domain
LAVLTRRPPPSLDRPVKQEVFMTGPEFVTVELFLATSDRSPHAAELAEWTSAVADLSTAADARVVVHDATALGGLAHGDETASAPTFVALLQIRQLPNGLTPRILAALAAALDQWPWLDRERSTVVLGPELVVVPGEQPLLLAMALCRWDAMSRAEFQRYWSTNHAELGRQVPGSQGYRQVHTDAELTNQARGILGVNGPDYDGVAIACYADQAAFLGIMANEAVVQTLLEDERKFIDHSAAAMVVGYDADNQRT